MRLLLILTFISTSLFSELTVSCKYSLESESIYSFSKLENSSLLSVVGEVIENGTQVVGDLDPANSSIAYWDNNSPICGGSNTFNRLVEAYCDYRNSYCFNINRGSTGHETIIRNENGVYTNNVIIVNDEPCLPYGVTSVTNAWFDYDNNDIGFATLSLNRIFDEHIFELTESEQKYQRDMCPNIISYIDELEDLKTSQNQAINKPITSTNILDFDFISSSLGVLNTSIQELSSNNSGLPDNPNYDGVTDGFNINPNPTSDIGSFEANIKNKIESSFTNYSNVFGLDGYGSTPKPISFSMFGKTYNAFDVSTFDEHIPMIRNFLASISYLWGFIFFIKGIK